VRYLLLVYAEEAGEAVVGERALVASHRLEGAATATTVCVRDGVTRIEDGAYGVSEQELRRLDVIDVPTLDEAIAAAERIPAARVGVVEIRPVARTAEAAA